MTDADVLAAADHEIPARPPIRIVPGDLVEVGERDTRWPRFVFVTTSTGSGWVPERHLSQDRPTATVISSYDTQELPVRAGERLTVLDDDVESGWSWCRNSTGNVGWVPHDVLR